MPSMSSARKAKFLNMPHGTATGRLRKMVLLHLLQKLGEDYCFRCKEKIETIKELTIEHKDPWEGVSVELFWDLENIAFSHSKCNRPHNYRNAFDRRRHIGPEGTAWCSGCKDFKPVNAFSKNKGHWNGLAKYCKGCKKLY